MKTTCIVYKKKLFIVYFCLFYLFSRVFFYIYFILCKKEKGNHKFILNMKNVCSIFVAILFYFYCLLFICWYSFFITLKLLKFSIFEIIKIFYKYYIYSIYIFNWNLNHQNYSRLIIWPKETKKNSNNFVNKYIIPY